MQGANSRQSETVVAHLKLMSYGVFKQYSAYPSRVLTYSTRGVTVVAVQLPIEQHIKEPAGRHLLGSFAFYLYFSVDWFSANKNALAGGLIAPTSDADLVLIPVSSLFL